jgi:MYXO-CTERM domain-containing protein
LVRRALASALAVAAALGMGAPALAAGSLVSPTGDDNAAGAAATPWRTLQRPWSTVRAGDTVTVEDGTYAGFGCDGTSGTAAAHILIRARNRWGAKITSASASSTEDYIQLNSCSFVTVDGFEVSGAPRSGIAILGNTDDGSDARGVIIQNCFAHDNGGAVVAGRHDGVFSGFALDLTIQDNRIDGTGEHGIYVSNAADNPAILRNDVANTGANGIQINADLSTGGDGLISNWRIEGNLVRNCRGSAGFNLDGAILGVARNNVIYNCAKGGITLFQGDGAQASRGNLIVNNTVYNPTGSRAAIQVASGANDNLIFNNIGYAQATGLEIQTVTGLVHDYNLVSSYTGGAASAHESNPAASALFVGPTTGDLGLLPTAAAVDHGVATLGGASAPATDILGAPRPAGAAIDIGAYEQGAIAPGGIGGASGASGGHPGSGGSSDAGRAPAAAGGGCGCRTGNPREGWRAGMLSIAAALAIGRRRRRGSAG